MIYSAAQQRTGPLPLCACLDKKKKIPARSLGRVIDLKLVNMRELELKLIGLEIFNCLNLVYSIAT